MLACLLGKRPAHGCRCSRSLAILTATALLACWGLILLAGCSSGDSAPPPPSGPVALADDHAAEYRLAARSDAFRLFYRERLLRMLTVFNRFALAGDVVAATAFGKAAIARQGNRFEVVPGPNDNNPIGFSAFTAYHAYRVFGGRELELTLIRLFEGLAFLEAVTGHPGLTVREALPGWTRTVNGLTGEVVRLRGGRPVVPPVSWPRSLEQEILQTFYSGSVFIYREDPGEYTFNLKPVQELEYYAITGVFSEPPRFLRLSDCCSSWMITQKGPWAGAYWGNHNSRDNFPDLSLGLLAAMECARDPSVPEDLRTAARHAEEAALRVGDRVLASGGALMTVGERGSYEDLVPSGQVRPDGATEWQDLGSMATCQMNYLARAISSQGLDLPLPELPLPGALEKMFLLDLLRKLGIEISLPDPICTDMDAALAGLGWGQILDIRLFGVPWYEFLKKLGEGDPGLIPSLFGSMMDDFYELQLAQLATCYYAGIFEKPELYEAALLTLENLIEMQRVFAYLLETNTAASAWSQEAAPMAAASEMLYAAAVFSRLFGLEAASEDLREFSPGEDANRYLESYGDLPDTAPAAILTQEEIDARIRRRLEQREPWIQDRYRERFGDSSPVRVSGSGYEALVDLDAGTWASAENPRHVWFGTHRFLFEIPLCVHDPDTLDCAWASRGCAPADLNGDGVADDRDVSLFEQAWSRFGPGGSRQGDVCTGNNDWCRRADLTRGGRVNAEDRDYLNAALGCRTGQDQARPGSGRR